MHRVFRSRWVLSGLSVTAGIGIGATLTATGDRLNKIRDTSHSSGLLERIPVIPIVDAASEITPYQPGQVTVSSSTAVMKYGFPSLSNIKSRESYVTSYDPRNRNRSLGHRAAQRRDSNRDFGQKVLRFQRGRLGSCLPQIEQSGLQGQWVWQGSPGRSSQSQMESESHGWHLLPEQCVTTGEQIPLYYTAAQTSSRRSHCKQQLRKYISNDFFPFDDINNPFLKCHL